MQNYREIIKERLRSYWKKGDEIYIIGSFVEDRHTCQLCGYNPIKNNFILQNSRTKEELVVGSNCVHNFKEAVKSLGQEVIIKTYDKNAIKQINRYHPGTVEFIEPEGKNYGDWSVFADMEELDVDDLSPEGMGSDEFDWDSFDYEPPER